MTERSVAQLIGASKKRGAVQALDRVDLAIGAGEIYALLGPNGAGKTTAISLLLGLLRPDAGEVRLFGRAPQDLAARRRIGVMLQSAGLPDTLSVAELLAQTRSYYPQPRSLADVAALAGIEPLLHARYARLSGGQQRRVQFALAICGRPELLFLDEPTVGMDTESRVQFWKTIRELVADGCAIVLTTHYLEEAEALARRVGVLAQGRLVAEDSLDAIRARVGQRQIRCVSAVPAERVRAWPQVHSVQRDGDWLHIVTPQPEPVLRELLAADANVRDLEVQRAGLAEALHTITREAA
ncbi:MAG TPA: ABC transporter ATP-binding protein [Tahibacter sp.]|uniref:ABC transporter ATP-binding protein n=1 Tax=Tahibacter sp. TaxID=2056211 RepID=UPI002BC3799C|nr:ABC transporter ATP-binding protein [Tahibacter sp.]HSX59102.1 ABC transporter ATP-binding protein [Tahibacter sp.]